MKFLRPPPSKETRTHCVFILLHCSSPHTRGAPGTQGALQVTSLFNMVKLSSLRKMKATRQVWSEQGRC